MPIELDPIIECAHELVRFLGRCAAAYSGFALAVRTPIELESQKPKSALLARVEPAETNQPGLFRCDRQVEFRQSFR